MLQGSSKSLYNHKWVCSQQFLAEKKCVTCPSLSDSHQAHPIEQHNWLLPRLHEEDEERLIIKHGHWRKPLHAQKDKIQAIHSEN